MKIRRQIATADTEPPKGFPKWAWWVLFVATFMFVVPLTSPWWSAILRSEVPDAADDEGEGAPAAQTGASPEPEETPGAMLKVTLFTRYPDRPGLQTIERDVPFTRGTLTQIQSAVSELARTTPETPALLPAGTRVVDVAFAANGTAYIDFSPEFEQGRGVGAEEEKTLVQGVVETVTANFAAVRRVVILVDGKAPKPGHFDLTRALRREDPIFAPDDPESPNAGTTPGAAPAPAESSTPIRPLPSPIR